VKDYGVNLRASQKRWP